MNWIDSVEEPAFCWVHYMDPHAPFRPHLYTVSHDITYRRSEYLSQKVMQDEDLTEDEWEDLRSLYYGEIEFVDTCIGSLLNWVSERFSPEETVVAFTSDHGELLGEYGKFSHRAHVYDELLRVPLCVRSPGDEAGTVEDLTSTLDLVPTLLQYVETDVPEKCWGVPIGQAPDDRIVFSHAGTFDDGKAMATDGEVKLVREMNGGDDTFRRDGEEIEPSSTEQAETLRTAMDEHLESVRESRTVDGADPDKTMIVDDSEAFRSRLEALGYREP